MCAQCTYRMIMTGRIDAGSISAMIYSRLVKKCVTQFGALAIVFHTDTHLTHKIDNYYTTMNQFKKRYDRI
jgi:hypothetical protein